MSEMRKHWNCTDDEIMALLMVNKARLSRIDLTINLYECKLTPQSMFKAYKADKVKAPVREVDLTSGIKDGIEGETFYIGARTSERYARVYDKAAEMKIQDAGAWVRFEMEIKGMKARATQHAISHNSVNAVINGHFSDFIQWPNREYQKAISGDSAEIDETGRKETNAEKWLMLQVSKALAKQCFLHPNFRAEFDTRVDFHLSELERGA